jgi:hypothetical protein
VTIHHKRYYRPRSNFNPTLTTDSQVKPSPYNYNIAVSKGILGAAVLNSNKRKFVIYNSDIKVENIRFYEATYEDATENALFFPYFSPYKWVTANNCIFDLRQQVVMTQEGGNINISNSMIDLSVINRVAIYQSLSQCPLYTKGFIANN